MCENEGIGKENSSAAHLFNSGDLAFCIFRLTRSIRRSPSSPFTHLFFPQFFFLSLSFSPLFPVRSPKRGGAGCGWYYTRALKVREMRTWLISTVPKSPPPPLPPPSFPNPVHLCKGEKNDWFSFFFFTLVYTSLHFYDYTKHHPLGPLPSLG